MTSSCWNYLLNNEKSFNTIYSHLSKLHLRLMYFQSRLGLIFFFIPFMYPAFAVQYAWNIKYREHQSNKMRTVKPDDCLPVWWNEKDNILIQISLKLIPEDPIDYKWIFVQVMAWYRIRDQRLPEPITYCVKPSTTYVHLNKYIAVSYRYFGIIFVQLQVFMISEPWWRHGMETLSALLALCTWNLPVTIEFP